MEGQNKEGKDLNNKLIQAAKEQDLVLVKELISSGADASFIYHQDGVWGAEESYSALHLAILALKHNCNEQEKETWREIILLLLKNGANPNAKKSSYDWRGCGSKSTAFELLSNRHGDKPDPDLFSAFIDAGLDPNIPRIRDIHSMRTDGSIRSYLLHDFVAKGSVDMTVVLLNAGADVNARAGESICNERGFREEKSETSLHVGVRRNELEICLLLLAKGADINAVESHYESERNENIVRLNQRIHDDPRDDRYKDPWKITSVQSTPLHLAIQQQNLEMISLLLLCNADVSIPYKREKVKGWKEKKKSGKGTAKGNGRERGVGNNEKTEEKKEKEKSEHDNDKDDDKIENDEEQMNIEEEKETNLKEGVITSFNLFKEENEKRIAKEKRIQEKRHRIEQKKELQRKQTLEKRREMEKRIGIVTKKGKSKGECECEKGNDEKDKNLGTSKKSNLESNFDILTSLENMNSSSEGCLSTHLESALRGTMDIKSILRLLSPDVQDKILNTLNKIKEQEWNFDICNFSNLHEILSS